MSSRADLSTIRTPVDEGNLPRLREVVRRKAAGWACEAYQVNPMTGEGPPGALTAAANAWAEVVAALALDPPPARKPGFCACGAALPLSATSLGEDSRRKHGVCRGCARATRRDATGPGSAA